MIDSRSLINSLITREAVKIATDLWGPSVGNLKRKVTRVKSDTIETGVDVITPLSLQILEFHIIVILGIYVIKVNRLPCFVSYGRVMKFRTTT